MPWGRTARWLRAAIAGLALLQIAALVTTDDAPTVAAAPASTTTRPIPPSSLVTTSTTVRSTSTSTTTTPPTTPRPPASTTTITPPTVPPTTTTAPRRACCAHWAVAPYRGVGAWVDVYDWTLSATNGRPSVTTATIDRMAAAGVQTIFLQTARTKGPDDLTEPARFRALADRAHAHGIAVVGWYLPDLVDVDRDLRRLLATLSLPLDGLSVNIEATDVADTDERSRRVVELTRRFRARVPDGVLGTVILGPVGLENRTEHWPDFPWADLRPHYDVWQPMAYFSQRAAGDPWRDATTYTAGTIERMRRLVGDDHLALAAGIADGLSADDVRDFADASLAGGAIGGSLYDWPTSSPGQWDALARLAR